MIEDVIPSVLLPQATSARHGAALLGALVSARGAGEAFGVLLADTSGDAWCVWQAAGWAGGLGWRAGAGRASCTAPHRRPAHPTPLA